MYHTVKFPTLSHSLHFPLVFRDSSFEGFHVPLKIKDFDVVGTDESGVTRVTHDYVNRTG